MCSINHDLKAIFIHLPKCGGSFTTSMLSKYYNFDNIRLPHEKHHNFNNFFEELKLFEDQNEINYIEQKDEDYYFNCQAKSYGDPWTTTEQGILRYNSSSKLYNFVMNMTEEKWKDYKKFTIIRNPYDKIVSAWKFINKCLKERKKQDIEFLEFEDYLNKTQEELYTYCKFAYSHSHITQYDHLLNINNEFDIDYIGHQENLNEDLCNILLKLGVDKIKHRTELEENKKINSNEHLDYVEYYTDHILKKVNGLLQADFDKFKEYKQVFTVEELKEESKKYLVSNDDFNKKNSELVERLEKDGLIIEKKMKYE